MSGITFNGKVQSQKLSLCWWCGLRHRNNRWCDHVPPSSGSRSRTGDIDHKTLITPTTVMVSSMSTSRQQSCLPVGSDLLPATADELGGVVPAGGKLEVDANGNPLHTPSGASTGPFTKVTLDTTATSPVAAVSTTPTSPPWTPTKSSAANSPSASTMQSPHPNSPTTPPASCRRTTRGATSSGSSGTPHPLHNLRLPAVPAQKHLAAGRLRCTASQQPPPAAPTTRIPTPSLCGSHRHPRRLRRPSISPPATKSGLYFICQAAAVSVAAHLNGISHTTGDRHLPGRNPRLIHLDVNGGGGGGGGGAQYLNDLLDAKWCGASSPFGGVGGIAPPRFYRDQTPLRRHLRPLRNTDIIDGGRLIRMVSSATAAAS